jgi:putative metalloprotease
MIKFAPIILALIYGIVMYRWSAWRTARMLDQQSTPLDDPALLAITDRLAQALDLQQIKVNIYEIDPVNGLAAPDGRIFITRGFFDRYKDGKVTGEELASVIAHELGHVALGHSRRRMIDFSGQNAMRTALAMVLGRFIPFIGPWLAGMLMSLLAARLSRKDEFEADAYASALMVKAGFGVEPQISLFEKLGKLTGAHGASAPAWLMSHPKKDQRIAAIQANAESWGT